MQQYNIAAFGSAYNQKSFSIDGLKTNWGGWQRRRHDTLCKPVREYHQDRSRRHRAGDVRD